MLFVVYLLNLFYR